MFLLPYVRRFLSRTGIHKVRPQPLTTNEELWLLNNTAFLDPSTNEWTAEFVAAYFSHDSGDKPAAIIADVIEKLGVVKGSEAEARVAKTVELFLNVIKPGRTVNLSVEGGKGEVSLGPADINGISSDLRKVPVEGRDGDLVDMKAILPAGYGPPNGFESIQTRLAGPTGWAVISDIDDTIKVTEVLSRTSLLKHTFALPPKAVTGMPELYRDVLTPLLNNPPWFYLSASPYNLYPNLANFVKNAGYPQGTLILRDMSWQELEAFIYISLTVGTEQYKLDRVTKVQSWLPGRKFVLIGDSTQRDVEVYGEACRRWPAWVGAVMIRVVRGVDEAKEKNLNSVERFETAFKGVPREIWTTFEDAREVEPWIRGRVEAVEAAGL